LVAVRRNEKGRGDGPRPCCPLLGAWRTFLVQCWNCRSLYQPTIFYKFDDWLTPFNTFRRIKGFHLSYQFTVNMPVTICVERQIVTFYDC
jgi:hypothetical protein